MDSKKAVPVQVYLQVGELEFTTLRSTLPDGVVARSSAVGNRYFVDADPVLFEHVLQYLRSSSFPLFFHTPTQTFDLALYHALLGEARYFGLRRLAAWIERRGYLDAVRVTRTVSTVEDVGADELQRHLDGLDGRANVKVDISIGWGTRKVYVCPRGLAVHRGDPSRCGQACKKMRERDDGGVEFDDEPVASAVIITTQVKLRNE
ncbi:hypothetical protein F4820DRAFT_89407 [Hypoxylon rubiginosum]|uniref:Uncharacterized protein n=1 Tax=Hypoxylon rubiginosum TaxID=110542 RepID=A0ACB9ZCB3_9PEZI|nr:hypothetical protein F4820DRAFT_89407 [Hypoxylon rubiginosum]